MHRGLQSLLRGRVIIAVIALYGLLLQGFLAAATPALTPDLAGIICASHDGSGPAAPDKSARHDHQCCTAAQPVPLLPPPDGGARLENSPGPPIATVTWRFEADIPSTGPPTRSTSARGPPSA